MDDPGRSQPGFAYAEPVSDVEVPKQPKPTRKGPATIGRRYLNALSDHDIDAALALWKPGSTDVLVGMAELRIPDEFSTWFGNLFRAIPDFEFEILSVTAQKDRAAIRSIVRGTFDGTAKFEGLSPNGARVEVDVCDLLTVRDGKIVENYGFLNGADMARQLGALPPQGSLAERGMTGALNAKVAAAKLLDRARPR